MKPTLYIFGGHSTALEIAEVAQLHCEDRFASVFRVVPEHERADSESTIPIGELHQHVIDRRELNRSNPGFILSMADQTVRSACLAAAEQADLQPANVIHPTALLSPAARIGQGIYIAAYVVVSYEAEIADHVVINFQSTIGHNSQIGEHTLVNPGARLGGNTKIGRRVLVGANSFVFQGKQVGDDTLIDAMTYVDRDIEAGQICSSRDLKVVKRPFFRRHHEKPTDAAAE